MNRWNGDKHNFESFIEKTSFLASENSEKHRKGTL